MNFRPKLLISFFCIGLLSVIITGWQSYDAAKSALEDASFNALTAIRDTKKREIELYFTQLRTQVVSSSRNPQIMEAFKDFKRGFQDIRNNTEALGATEAANVREYYYRDFFPNLTTQPSPQSIDDFVPESTAAQYLQHHYITNNPHAVGNKDDLIIADNDHSYYQQAHGEHHLILQSLLESNGYYDIFFIDGETGEILYTVYKEVDLGTNLLTGAYNNTGLAKAFVMARDAPNEDFSVLVDFSPYPPSYYAPAAFFASPIFDGPQQIGVFAFQIPIDRINNTMTGFMNWEKEGLGRTGETYLVAQDLTMRNDSRFFIQDSDNFFKQIEEQEVGQEVAVQMQTHGTSILFQPVTTVGVDEALKGNTGTSTILDYRGVPVLSSYSPLDITNVNWVILSEIDQDETFYPVYKLRNRIVLTGLIISFLVIVLAIFFSNKISQPIRKLIQGMHVFGAGDLSARVHVESSDETGQLAKAFNEMADDLQITTVSKNYVDDILSSMSEGLFVIDRNPETPQWCVKTVNPSALKLLGYNKDEVIGEDINDFFPEHILIDIGDEKRKSWIEEVLTKGTLSSKESVCLTKGGEKSPILFSSAFMHDNGTKQLVCIAQDIRELKEAQSQKTFIQETFGRYVSEDVLVNLLKSPEGLRLGGELRHVTVMSADIRGFTFFAESEPAEAVVSLLNRYLEGMTNIVSKYQGDVNQIVGDGLLIIFGAPISRDNDTIRALACAAEMQISMKSFNEQLALEGFPTLGLGIGLHTGDVIVGNVGSNKRMKYTAIGRDVNLACRIESYAIGGQILISERTLKEVKDLIRYAPPFTVHPKGMSEPVPLFEVEHIAGEWNLSVPDNTTNFHKLGKPQRFVYSILEGKKVGIKELEGSLLELAVGAMIVELHEKSEVLQNMVITLPHVGEVYCKSVRCLDGVKNRYELSITAAPENIVDKIITPDSMPEPRISDGAENQGSRARVRGGPEG
jgi:PAS domain S-box-containing protein